MQNSINMEIKDFIEDALIQIVDGVQQANSTLATKGAFVPTEDVAGAEGYFCSQIPKKGEPIKRYIKVDFDVAIEVAKSNIDETEAQGDLDGELKLQVASIAKAGFDLKGGMTKTEIEQHTQQNIHHIKFSLPLSLPSTK